MYTKDQMLFSAAEELFFHSRDGRRLDEETIRDLLEDVDYEELAQAARHKAETVFSYAVDGTGDTFRYRSSELFGGLKATRICSDLTEGSGTYLAGTPESAALSVRYNELWLTEDMKFHWVACVTTEVNGRGYRSEYRGDKGDPAHTGMDIPLDEISGALGALCEEYVQSAAPVYEL